MEKKDIYLRIWLIVLTLGLAFALYSVFVLLNPELSEAPAAMKEKAPEVAEVVTPQQTVPDNIDAPTFVEDVIEEDTINLSPDPIVEGFTFEPVPEDLPVEPEEVEPIPEGNDNVITIE